jgi:hypothetical protein
LVDFIWNPEQLKFVPTYIEAEVSPVDSNVVGGWRVDIDGTCDNESDSRVYWTINNNGTLLSSTGNEGTWELQDNDITIHFGSTTYTGTVNPSNNTINGTFVYSNNTGCWFAIKGTNTQQTWQFWVADFNDTYRVDLKSKHDYTFDITFTYVTGNPFLCVDIEYVFLQGNNIFYLTDFRLSVNSDTALITYDTVWNGCDYIYQGQTITGHITHIPLWFNSNSTFRIGVNSDVITLEPDGTTHR